MVLPDQAAKDIEPEWFVEGENIRVADAFIVDIMFNANGQTFETLRHKDTADRIIIEPALEVMGRRPAQSDLHRTMER